MAQKLLVSFHVSSELCGKTNLILFKLEITCNDKKKTAGSLLSAVEKTVSEDKFVQEYFFAFAHTFDDDYDDEVL